MNAGAGSGMTVFTYVGITLVIIAVISLLCVMYKHVLYNKRVLHRYMWYRT